MKIQKIKRNLIFLRKLYYHFTHLQNIKIYTPIKFISLAQKARNYPSYAAQVVFLSLNDL